jgi:hypothetical protein
MQSSRSTSSVYSPANGLIICTRERTHFGDPDKNISRARCSARGMPASGQLICALCRLQHPICLWRRLWKHLPQRSMLPGYLNATFTSFPTSGRSFLLEGCAKSRRGSSRLLKYVFTSKALIRILVKSADRKTSRADSTFNFFYALPKGATYRLSDRLLVHHCYRPR